jgi:hypothetical protein
LLIASLLARLKRWKHLLEYLPPFGFTKLFVARSGGDDGKRIINLAVGHGRWRKAFGEDWFVTFLFALLLLLRRAGNARRGKFRTSEKLPENYGS